MIKRYVYKGTVYRTANALRKAVWHSEHKVCDREPEENKIEFWKKNSELHIRRGSNRNRPKEFLR